MGQGHDSNLSHIPRISKDGLVSGVVDDLQSQFWTDFCNCIRSSPHKFPIAHWQTAGDYESLIRHMPDMIKLYRDNGHPVEFVWLDSMPGRTLKHEWYADLYNQKMWDWCKQFSVIDSKKIADEDK